MSLKFKNYIFDMGQVIVRFDTAHMTRAYIKDEADVKLAEEVIFDRLYWDRLDEGTITDEEIHEGIKSRLPERLWENAIAVYDNWFRNMPFIEGMLELIDDIHKIGGKLFLLSNVSTGFAEGYSTVPTLRELFSKFDGLVFSGVIKKVKPQREIFEHVLNEFMLKADESIFIDDNDKNIEGAKVVGLHTYLFDGDAEALREKLV